jgi:uncharacterized protein YbaR (Trm112 family)
MRRSDIEYLRCPVTQEPLTLWQAMDETDDGDIIEGVLTEEDSGLSYAVHEGLPILLPKGRRAVDDLATLLALSAEDHGFAEAARMLADGELIYPIEESYGQAVTPIEKREAAEAGGEAFWSQFSRQRLVQQQLNAIDQHWDALEEMWLRADINYADSILDVGTGWGGTISHLLDRGPQDARVVGLDTAFLNTCIAKGCSDRSEYDHYQFVVGDITMPPFASNSFESVVSWFGIGTIPQFSACLEGVYKLLGSGFAFAAAWTPTLAADLEGLTGPDVLARMSARLDIPQSPRMASEAAEMVGFDEVEVTEVGPIYVLSGRRPA